MFSGHTEGPGDVDTRRGVCQHDASAVVGERKKMVRKGNGGNGSFAECLVSLIEGADDASIWRELAQELRNRPKDESHTDLQERFLRVAKAMREAGVLSDDEAFYVIAHPIISIAEERVIFSGAHPALDAISKKIRHVERAHGLAEDEDWPRGEYNRKEHTTERSKHPLIAT